MMGTQLLYGDANKPTVFIMENAVEVTHPKGSKIPFVKEEYFQDGIEKVIFKSIWQYADEYKSAATVSALAIELQKATLNDEHYKTALEYLEGLENEEVGLEWLTDQTEKWCKDRAVYNGVMNSIEIIQDKQGNTGEIPDILREALSVSFDSNIGHDFIEDWNDRYEFMHREEERVPFDLDLMNKIIGTDTKYT